MAEKTINELRKEHGLSEIPDGDTVLVSKSNKELELARMEDVKKVVKFYYGITEEQFKSLKDEVLSIKGKRKITMAVLMISNIVMVMGMLYLIYCLK